MSSLYFAKTYYPIKAADITEDSKKRPVATLHVTRVGENHDNRFTITREHLQQFKAHFDANAFRTKDGELLLNFGHNRDGEAAGWITEVFISEDGDNLWAKARLTPLGKRAVDEELYRYVSAEWYFDYADPELKKEYGTVLIGAALVNNPAVKDLEEVKAMTKEKKAASITLDDVMGFISTASADEKAQIVEACGGYMDEPAKEKTETKPAEEPASEKKEASSFNREIRAMNDRLNRLEAENSNLKKEREFNEMLKAGQVVESQRAPYMKSDFTEFAKIATALKASATTNDGEGHGLPNGEITNASTVKLNDNDRRLMKKYGYKTEQEYLAASGQAVKQ